MAEEDGRSISRVVEIRILGIRGRNVLLNFDLADLYGVQTKALNQAVTRNADRFPEDLMFRLSADEVENLNRSQFVTGSQKNRAARHPPRAFTQEGVAMLSSVLRSKRAVMVNIEIMRTFVRLRWLQAGHEELSRKLSQLERKYDTQFKVVFDTILELMQRPTPPDKPQIGFRGETDS